MSEFESNPQNINFNISTKTKLLGMMGGAVLLIIIFWSNMTVTIGAGESGVLFKTFSGGVDITKTYGEGFHFIAPWNDMVIYEVRQQEVFEKMAVLSSNGLEISIDLSLWHQPFLDKLPLLHKEKGRHYEERVIRPAMRSAARSVIGRYTPEQIYSTKRDAVQDEIAEETKRILKTQFIRLNEVLVRDITLPLTIKTAIENKLRQEQEALEYEFKLKKANKEAQKIRIEAQGKADANRILSASLTDKILQEKGIEATLKLSESPNAKIIVVGGGKSGLPLILNSSK